MNEYHPEELLNDRSRRTDSGQPDARSRERYRDAIIALTPLLDLARDLSALLRPVRPPVAYRAELHRGLVAAAQQQRVQYALFPPTPAHSDLFGRMNDWAGQGLSELSEGDRRWVVGAAVVGSALSLSLAGLAGYMLHRRGRAA